MQRAMISRIKLLKMNRDNAPTLETWGAWDKKLNDAIAAYNKQA